MSNEDMLKGAKIVGDAAAAKFTEIKNDIGGIRDKFSSYTKTQGTINDQLIDHADEQRERLQALEDNRYYIKMSRHGLDDMTGTEAERIAGWLQRLIFELKTRGFPPSLNQQSFLANIFKYIGLQDELMEIEGLDEIERFGDSNVHEVLYKIFLVTVYLQSNAFDLLSQLDDIKRMFKLSEADKNKMQSMLEDQRIPTLGVSGLIEMFNPSKPLNSFSVESLISKNTNIYSHTLARYKLSNDDLAVYIKSFAILAPVDGKFSEKQRNFIASIARLLGCLEAIYDLDSLCLAKQNINLQQLQNILNTDEQKFAWGLDSAVILGLSGQEVLEKNNIVGQILRSFKILESEDFVSAAFNLPRTEASSNSFNDIACICKYCKDWKHVAEFSGVSFKGLFSDLSSRLDKNYWKSMELSAKCIEASANSIDNMDAPEAFSDNFIEKMAAKAAGLLVASRRADNLKELLAIKNDTENLLNSGCDDLHQANNILKVFGIKIVEFNDVKFRMQTFDLDNSAANEDWSNDFDGLNDLLQDTLDKFSDAAQILEEQLKSFEQGNMYESILEKKEKVKKMALEKERQELESKKVVELNDSNSGKKLKISWQDVATRQFETSDISRAASDGTNWIVIAGEKLYFSSDGNSWSGIDSLPSIDRYGSIFYVNGTWVYISTTPELHYSRDLTTWEQGFLPDDLVFGSIRLCYFDDSWVLCAEKYKEYSYTEKGFIFDSKETASYNAPVFYRSASLDDNWKRWDEACSFDEGICLRSSHFASAEKLIISAFSMDPFFYDRKKKTSLVSGVSYIKPCGSWKQATLPKDKLNLWDCGVYFWKNKWICLCQDGVMTSSNGFEWKVVLKDVSITTSLIDFSDVIFILATNQKTAFVSADGIDFAELALTDKDGRWNHFAVKGKEVLAVFAPSEHEVFLKKGILDYIA